MAEEKLNITVKARVNQAVAGLKKVQGSAVAATAAITGAAVAARALGDAVADAVKAFAEQDAANGEMLRSLKAAGGGLKDFAAAQESVRKISRVSGATTIENTKAFQSLLDITNDVTKATADLALANDIAAAKGISVEKATKAVVKARQGDVVLLKKLGIATKDTIDDMSRIEDEATRTAAAMDLLASEFEGAAEENAGLQRNLDNLSSSLEDLEVATGQAITGKDGSSGIAKLVSLLDQFTRLIVDGEGKITAWGHTLRIALEEGAKAALPLVGGIAALSEFVGIRNARRGGADPAFDPTAGARVGARIEREAARFQPGGTLFSGPLVPSVQIKKDKPKGKGAALRGIRKNAGAAPLSDIETEEERAADLERIREDSLARKLRAEQNHSKMLRDQKEADAEFEKDLIKDVEQARSAAADIAIDGAVGLAEALGAPKAATAALEGGIELGRATAATARAISGDPTGIPAAAAHYSASAQLFAAAAMSASGGGGGGKGGGKAGGGGRQQQADPRQLMRENARIQAEEMRREQGGNATVIKIDFGSSVHMQDSAQTARMIGKALDENNRRTL